MHVTLRYNKDRVLLLRVNDGFGDARPDPLGSPCPLLCMLSPAAVFPGFQPPSIWTHCEDCPRALGAISTACACAESQAASLQTPWPWGRTKSEAWVPQPCFRIRQQLPFEDFTWDLTPADFFLPCPASSQLCCFLLRTLILLITHAHQSPHSGLETWYKTGSLLQMGVVFPPTTY